MDEYFYTLDLGKKFGPLLQRLAVRERFDDVEEFASLILCRELEAMEAAGEDLSHLLTEEPPATAGCTGNPQNPLDDEIPF